ncbi:MAG TPA: hypothetical protein VJ436_11150 [Anaerolineales bacterium]|nr:hypothetical protein [Anaerolineales bacterium]
MYNNDTELLFPPRVIPTLRLLRGEDWQELVDRVLRADPTARERLAFVLMMVRLGGCVFCHADSFRAMRGCTQCARNTLRRFRGEDLELIELFDQASQEVDRYLENGRAAPDDGIEEGLNVQK